MILCKRADMSFDAHLPMNATSRGTLRTVRRAARTMPVNIFFSKLRRLGNDPNEIMEQTSDFRREGVRLRINSEGANQSGTDQFVRALMTELSILERQETTRRTSKAVHSARAHGSPSGRPLVMTPERQAIATRMLKQGKRGREILSVVRGLDGSAISQSAYYLWRKKCWNTT